ncbi:PREDICTED: ly6/PLAUR domain-containing protein 1 [Aptenodytes forsteri]|nr:PREDICTED: ly6/PLAUR domain-containing protein 1 [Aptenodytes forsteri]
MRTGLRATASLSTRLASRPPRIMHVEIRVSHLDEFATRRLKSHFSSTQTLHLQIRLITIIILSKILSVPGLGLQIQCYQCEEFQLNNDCSAPEFIVNCTVNVQDMCQKEVMEKSFGIMYRKSCASSAACLIASAGYQSFCSPGKVNSVCISCCNTPLCNGPRPKKRGNSGVVPRAHVLTTVLLLKLALLVLYC